MLPRVRGLLGVLAVVTVFLIRDIELLLVLWAILVIPIIYVSGLLSSHARFVFWIVLPISFSLIVVWGILVGAPPGLPLGSDPSQGLQYAIRIAARITLAGGILQLVLLSIPPKDVARTFHSWGLRGPLLLVAVAVFPLVAELRLRVQQVYTARLARGYLTNRGLRERLSQLPFVIRPLLAWTLRSALQRAEAWEARNTLQLVARAATSAALRDRSQPSQRRPGDIGNTRIVGLQGSNLSGRTDTLRGRLGSRPGDDGPARPGLYIGPEVYNSLSGLARTVREELRLHSAYTDVGWIDGSLEALRIAHLLENEPFQGISGGEQVLVATLSTLSLLPPRLAIDCALEQLDIERRQTLLKWIRAEAPTPEVLVADSRLSEFSDDISDVEMMSTRPTAGNRTMLPLDGLSADVDIPPPPITPCPLSIDGLRFAYAAQRHVFTDLTFEFEPGRIYTLHGPNGAGKSTVAKLLTGVLKLHAGTIHAAGERLTPWKTPGQAVGYHFQNPDLQLFATTVEEEVRPRSTHDPGAFANRSQAVLESLGLAGVRQMHPQDLPFMARKRTALAATIAMPVPWLILDEPTLNQDDLTVRRLATILRRLASQGVGILVIAHSPWVRREFGGTPLVLERGELSAQSDM